MDIEQLRADIKANLDERAKEQKTYDEARSKLDDVTRTAKDRGDGVLNEDETKALKDADGKADTARKAMVDLDEARSQMEQRVEDITAAEEARQAAEKAAEKYGGTEPLPIRGGKEEPVYRKDGDASFFSDMYRYRYDADPLAADRILRHARQHQMETRDASTGSFAGLVIPKFLVDDFASVARAGRPFADLVGGRDLPPDGMIFNIPKGNTGVVVSSQTSENTATAEQDVDNDDIAVAVRTIAGQQDISRQSLDRGRNVDEMVMSDLAAAYAAELDRQLINGTGANNQHLGVLSTTDVATVTVTSTNGVTQIRQIYDGVQRVHSTRFMPATVVAVHPRRWAYWAQSTDSNGRPLVTQNGHGPQNVFGTGDITMSAGIVGDIGGMPVMVDPNIPTTLSNDSQGAEDAVIITRVPDLRLWEDDPMPRRVRFEETLAGQLTVKIVAWDYSAFSAARYPSASIVLAGSGLTTPAFAS